MLGQQMLASCCSSWPEARDEPTRSRSRNAAFVHGEIGGGLEDVALGVVEETLEALRRPEDVAAGFLQKDGWIGGVWMSLGEIAMDCNGLVIALCSHRWISLSTSNQSCGDPHATIVHPTRCRQEVS